jgi:hypothetical protein
VIEQFSRRWVTAAYVGFAPNSGAKADIEGLPSWADSVDKVCDEMGSALICAFAD